MEVINTSIVYIDSYIRYLINAIRETNLSEEIVMNLKIAWGCPKKEKLAKIRNRKYLGSTNCVMPEFLF